MLKLMVIAQESALSVRKTLQNRDGVTAVEYAIIAAAAAAVLGIAFGSFYGGFQTALEGIFKAATKAPAT